MNQKATKILRYVNAATLMHDFSLKLLSLIYWNRLSIANKYVIFRKMKNSSSAPVHIFKSIILCRT